MHFFKCTNYLTCQFCIYSTNVQTYAVQIDTKINIKTHAILFLNRAPIINTNILFLMIHTNYLCKQ